MTSATPTLTEPPPWRPSDSLPEHQDQDFHEGRRMRDLILALAGRGSETKHEGGAKSGDNDKDHSEGVPRCRRDVLLSLEHHEALEVADQEGGH